MEATQSTSTPHPTPAYPPPRAPRLQPFQRSLPSGRRRSDPPPSQVRGTVQQAARRVPSRPRLAVLSTTSRSTSATTQPRTTPSSTTSCSTSTTTQPRTDSLSTTSPHASTGSLSEKWRHYILLIPPTTILHLVYLFAAIVCTCVFSYAAGCLSGCALER